MVADTRTGAETDWCFGKNHEKRYTSTALGGYRVHYCKGEPASADSRRAERYNILLCRL